MLQIYVYLAAILFRCDILSPTSKQPFGERSIHAWEVSQHVGHAIEAHQPEYLTDAQGRGAGCDLRTKRKVMTRPRVFKDLLRATKSFA